MFRERGGGLPPLACVALSGVLGVAGQLILKRGLAALGPLVLRPDTVVGLAVALALNPLVLLGLGVYLAGTFFWLLALSRVDLSYAYPFASLNYVLVLLASWGILGERPSLVRFAGVAAIGVGVWAISRTPARTTGRAFPPVPAPDPEVSPVVAGAPCPQEKGIGAASH